MSAADKRDGAGDRRHIERLESARDDEVHREAVQCHLEQREFTAQHVVTRTAQRRDALEISTAFQPHEFDMIAFPVARNFTPGTHDAVCLRIADRC